MFLNGVKSFASMPGPWGVPFLGSPSLVVTNPIVLSDWANEYYGNVFRYKIFTQDYVALNGYEAIKEALVTNGWKLSGRLSNPLIDTIRRGKGLFFVDQGKIWSKWKPFALSALSEIMKGMTLKICDQASLLLSDMSQEGFDRGASLDIKELLKYRMAKISFVSFVGDEEINRNEFEDVMNDVYRPFRSKRVLATTFLSTLVASVPPFNNILQRESDRHNSVMQKIKFWLKKLRDKQTNSRQDNIAASFFKETPSPSDDDLDQLSTLLVDWIFAGSSTTAEQTLWVLLLLLKHPEVLNDVRVELQQSLEKVESVDKLYENQSLVPQLMASIQEAMRLKPIAPISFFHKTIEEVTLGGYKVPKGVMITPNLWSVHHDPKIWGDDTEVFRPSRHLDENGNFISSEYVIAFSLGERRCAGEKLARANIFIVLASLLSRYDIELAPESILVDSEGEMKSILQTPNFKIISKQ